jgi:hypothetical protein
MGLLSGGHPSYPNAQPARPDSLPMLTVPAVRGALPNFQAMRTCSIAVTTRRLDARQAVDPAKRAFRNACLGPGS